MISKDLLKVIEIEMDNLRACISATDLLKPVIIAGGGILCNRKWFEAMEEAVSGLSATKTEYGWIRMTISFNNNVFGWQTYDVFYAIKSAICSDDKHISPKACIAQLETRKKELVKRYEALEKFYVSEGEALDQLFEKIGDCSRVIEEALKEIPSLVSDAMSKEYRLLDNRVELVRYGRLRL